MVCIRIRLPPSPDDITVTLEAYKQIGELNKLEMVCEHNAHPR
jgi:hypothetical protein